MNSLVFLGSSWLWFLFTIQFLLSCYPERWNKLDSGRAWVCRLGWAAGRLGFREHPQNSVTGIWEQIGFPFFNLLSLIIEPFSVAYPGGHWGARAPRGPKRGGKKEGRKWNKKGKKREKKGEKRGGAKEEGRKRKGKREKGGETKRNKCKRKLKKTKNKSGDPGVKMERLWQKGAN